MTVCVCLCVFVCVCVCASICVRALSLSPLFCVLMYVCLSPCVWRYVHVYRRVRAFVCVLVFEDAAALHIVMGLCTGGELYDYITASGVCVCLCVCVKECVYIMYLWMYVGRC